LPDDWDQTTPNHRPKTSESEELEKGTYDEASATVTDDEVEVLKCDLLNLNERFCEFFEIVFRTCSARLTKITITSASNQIKQQKDKKNMQLKSSKRTLSTYTTTSWFMFSLCTASPVPVRESDDSFADDPIFPPPTASFNTILSTFSSAINEYRTI
jgi:hypothetical protein